MSTKMNVKLTYEETYQLLIVKCLLKKLVDNMKVLLYQLFLFAFMLKYPFCKLVLFFYKDA